VVVIKAGRSWASGHWQQVALNWLWERQECVSVYLCEKEKRVKRGKRRKGERKERVNKERRTHQT
jgi:hypothetical protein